MIGTVASAKVTVTLAQFAARNSRAVRHKRSNNAFIAMAAAWSNDACYRRLLSKVWMFKQRKIDLRNRRHAGQLPHRRKFI